MTASARWRRLDRPGIDEARLVPAAEGYRLTGLAAYRDPAGPVAVRYEIAMGADWATRSATLTGTTAAGPVRIDVTTDAQRRWAFNGRNALSVMGCIDVDLGFTPATNLLSIRRLALAVGAQAEVTVAWLPSLTAPTLQPLRQVYHRISDDRVRYTCPDLPFDTTLRVDAAGFVRDYPPLWEELR